MKIRVPKYFKDFKCIASECEDTCCAGWGIVIDDETYKKYQKVEGDFGDRLRSEIVHDGGENIFVLKGNDCPFLNENKLCDIYNEVGEDALCYTCKQYPRYMEEFGGLREIGISLSCPEAARIILRNEEKAIFELSENEEEVNSYNDINAKLYIELMQCRQIVLNILQDRDINLNTRVAIFLCFTKEIQDKIDENEITDIKSVREKYSDKEFIKEVISSFEKYNNNEDAKYNNMKEYFNVFKSLKHINPNDPLGLDDAIRYFWQSEEDKDIYLAKNKAFDKYYEDSKYKFEQILVYFIFRYFMKAVFDYDVSAKVKTAIVSYLMIKELCVVRFTEEGEVTDDDIVDISHMYSKDIEHLEENIEALAEIFETNDVFTVEEMIVNLMN
ncbi:MULTISPECIES: flagellin lysine-N-methylase [unclassified Clostridium]|uniref:flagellin lysine-N-methylase n=1 Tax=unclassified Clostridium TaxID=2614128 RepID=UPI001C8C2401|nr:MULTISPECIES: flagellin lysine-N-methylase [unclassified Clostridium]MBX9139389.1 flagellar protein FliB [Clostridium sp. K12(2020)]MBX9146125.1 flagellar protein FliB [Clostridium sp. K13]MDU4327054.1 flagellin lysine-N-methylase [Clostridium celatum]